MGRGFPEAVGGMGGGGEGTQALRRQECSRRGAVAHPLSAAPPSAGSSAPSVITPAVTTPGRMTQSLHPPTRHDRRCTPPHCTLGKERRGVGRRGRTPPHGQSLTHPLPVHYPCSQGPPSLAGAPIPPIRQLGPRMPHPKAGVPGGEAEMPTRVPRPPHPIATISPPCPILTPLTRGPQDGSPNPPNEGPPSTAADSGFTGCPGSPASLWAQPPAPQALLFVVLGPWPSPTLITRPCAGSGIWSAVPCCPVTDPDRCPWSRPRPPPPAPASSPPEAPGQFPAPQLPGHPALPAAHEAGPGTLRSGSIPRPGPGLGSCGAVG